ncbi:hypothetical protein [Cellulomonas soli]|uniref:Peptidoglycan binding-like domain-containing protein n=1 Tax=Cellulomonas soli TaxID=931535 RepID=A0A512P8R5_9CELL|nr:hypothetical protein [Cellulomonas soli]NYI57795.1 hypothetical protein [Cellulomonas soli]GEP67579.1 hypothetical protein CSO01_02940 [Cellulomonas soli]
MSARARVAGSRRTIILLAVVAVLSLVAGLGLSRLVQSPGAAAAEAAPPAAGPITVPVERRVIANDVVLRGDVGYEDPVPVRVETGEIEGRAVVTGQVPAVGATLDATSVALEVAGRPVIVLPGDLPTYRTLRAGVSGPDVSQLKAALGALGIDAGDPASDEYDAKAAAGVRALYQRVGYEPPSATEDLAAAVKAAQQGVTAAEEDLAAAKRELTTAQAGPTTAHLTELDAAVNVARVTLEDAQAACTAPTDEVPCDRAGLTRAQGDLDVALAARDEADNPADTSAQSATVTSASSRLTEARADLATAKQATLTPLPASEVVFMAALPRRVDDVTVKRGGTVEGPVMSVSGATLEIVGSAAKSDADLLTVGAVGSILLDDQEIPVKVTAVAPEEAADDATDGTQGDTSEQSAAPTAGRFAITFSPDALTPEQVVALQGTNVRIRVPVGSTEGEVLAVPLAALTAGPGGESRVELSHGETSELVTVTTGLAAQGYVEIASSTPALAEGDLVVVGITGSDPSSAGDEATAGEDGSDA